ncbi:unnamed protein product [Paramecium pentaurelia]|uniref:Uncharacterized protein n=1 Tax=Paramecium pentaurelia TaxID=43138 RepID=A0A8S1URF4_9CILI|nr:unnamed protein product [Paramecium pentaurelia]
MKNYADLFMNQAKGVTEEDKLIGLLNQIQDQIFTQISNDVNNKLIKELQKNANLTQTTQQPEFLRVTPNIDTDYMHSHINFAKSIQSNQPMDRQKFEQFENKEVVNFPIYQSNYLDVNANAKFYYPKTQPKGLIETPKQYVDQTNVQNYLINQTKIYDFNQPEIKQIFPRNLVDNMIPTHPEPDYVKQQESKFNFSSQINQMGGLINTIGPMNQSLKQNEQRLFLNTPEHSLLAGALQEKINHVPPPFVPVPAPPPPDPFLTNPQYRLYGVQQEPPQFNVQSYIPEKSQIQPSKLTANSNIQQVPLEKQEFQEISRVQSKVQEEVKLNFLDRARQERKRREEKLIQ